MSDILSDLQAHFGTEYTVERELTGGGMSRVVVARDAALDRHVVIKVLPPNVTATISVDRFRREIMLAAALQHPNIVPVLRAGELNGVPFFVMPYIEGESLRARMMRGPLSVRETVTILKDVARALAFAHGRGIIHRDIKPDNVMLSAGAAVVADFGVAKALSASRTTGPRPVSPTITGVGMSPGTPAYMAPEQAAADPKTDHRADIYSLGILAYEMLAGTPPFHGRTPQMLLAAQLSEKPAPLSTRRYDVPKLLSDLINQCLEKDPARRPDSAVSVLRTLEDPATLSGVFEAPVSARRRWERGRAWPGISLLVATGVATWTWSARQARLDATPPASAVVAPAISSQSIAVLPLESVGNDARTRDVAAGITSELANAMAGVAGLRVTSNATASAIRDRLRASTDRTQPLDVSLLLEGTVQRERNTLRVTVRLVQAGRDSTMWSQLFQGSADSVLQLQTTVVSAAAAAVAARTR
ncbi:MAG: protein kinase domain-containing protein [Gemmatimonadaceae bacterium]